MLNKTPVGNSCVAGSPCCSGDFKPSNCDKNTYALGGNEEHVVGVCMKLLAELCFQVWQSFRVKSVQKFWRNPDTVEQNLSRAPLGVRSTVVSCKPLLQAAQRWKAMLRLSLS